MATLFIDDSPVVISKESIDKLAKILCRNHGFDPWEITILEVKGYFTLFEVGNRTHSNQRVMQWENFRREASDILIRQKSLEQYEIDCRIDEITK